MAEAMIWPGVVERYRDRLEIDRGAPAVTLLEGNTPLIPAPRLAATIAPGARLFLKYEGLNPTGSFKDRGMTAAITQAAAGGARAVICASTGNTAASAAAYAARAGMTCAVVVPRGKVAAGKLAGAVAYGARLVTVEGSFDDALRMVREACEQAPIALVNSVNPARIQGQKTAAFEVIAALGDAPDWLCLPVGNAGNITAYWLGFREAHARGEATLRPRLMGVQAAGAAPLVLGHVVARPETLASAIRIGNPARGDEALAALRESDGAILAVPDEAILEAYRAVAHTEGVFCEPSSAAGIAGLAARVRAGELDPEGRTIVCVLTGHGLKDPDTALAGAHERPPIAPECAALLNALHEED